MADYWITFRIASDAGYQTRYDGLIEALNKNGSGFWSEPTSFVCIRTNLNITTLGARLKAPLSERSDILVIREIGKDNTAYAGVPDDSFEAFFPNAKKL